jgi:undecaprenyl-diphosphatase
MEKSKISYQNLFKQYPGGLIIRIFLFGISLLFFRIIAHNVFGDLDVGLDHFIFQQLNDHIINSRLTFLMEKITWFASATFLQIGTIGLMFLLIILKSYTRAIEAVVICVGGYLLNHILKLIYQRVRPPDPMIEPLSNFSFPSGHATSGFIFYGLIAYFILKSDLTYFYKYALALLLVFFSVLIGFSRVYLHIHYFSDVIAGFCVGFSWLTLSTYLIELYKTRRASSKIDM